MAANPNNPRYTISPLGKDAVRLHRFHGSERISTLFEFTYALLSDSGTLSANNILGQGLTLTCQLAGGGKRYLHGVVAEFSQFGFGDVDQTHVYRAVVRPWFWFLTRTADCRIFEHKSVPEIFELVVKAYGFSDYSVAKLTGSYAKLEYCVQYRETDFNFLSRLLEHEGIYYYFEHHAGRHVLVLVDDSGAHQPFPGYASVPYLAEGAAFSVRDPECVHEWSVAQRFDPVTFATTDFDFTAPNNSLLANATMARQYAQASFEIFDYPAPLDTFSSAESNRIAKLRIQELQATQALASGRGDALGLAPGYKFALTDHPVSDLNIEYLVLGADYTVTVPGFRGRTGAEAGAAAEEESFEVSIEAIDARTTYRPPRRSPKPVVHGAQTAMVVDDQDSGDEIVTDQYGRVKVKFPWIRPTAEVTSSCWVRVSQLWAGAQWGAMHIPRVGQEVIVDFLEGDPDRPIITGRVYNAESMPPYALPGNKTQSGIKSRSSTGGSASTYNELRFEDKSGSEQVVLHAQKDLLVEVGHNGTLTVTQDQSTTISGNLATTVKKDETRTLQGARTTTVTKDDSTTVTKNYTLTADKITLTAGPASIEINSNGEITLTGTKITLSGQQEVDVSALKISVSASTELQLASQVTLGVQGAKTSVQGTMLSLSGSATTQISGGMITIG